MQRDRLCPMCKISWDSEKLGRDCPKCKCDSFMTIRSGDIGVAIYMHDTGLNGDDFPEYTPQETDQ